MEAGEKKPLQRRAAPGVKDYVYSNNGDKGRSNGYDNKVVKDIVCHLLDGKSQILRLFLFLSERWGPNCGRV